MIFSFQMNYLLLNHSNSFRAHKIITDVYYFLVSYTGWSDNEEIHF